MNQCRECGIELPIGSNGICTFCVITPVKFWTCPYGCAKTVTWNGDNAICDHCGETKLKHEIPTLEAVEERPKHDAYRVFAMVVLSASATVLVAMLIGKMFSW